MILPLPSFFDLPRLFQNRLNRLLSNRLIPKARKSGIFAFQNHMVGEHTMKRTLLEILFPFVVGAFPASLLETPLLAYSSS